MSARTPGSADPKMRSSHAPVFLGDELSAAGFCLGGAIARVPARGEEAAMFERARQQAPLVLITPAVAERLPAGDLARALAATAPLVLIVPDVRGREQPPDLTLALRRQLGIEE
jgi:vacuolar-type H+-ATPase subunit F/Vma7